MTGGATAPTAAVDAVGSPQAGVVPYGRRQGAQKYI